MPGRGVIRLIVAAVLLVPLAACVPGRPSPVTLSVLASPDLADMAPVLDDLAGATGVRLVLDVDPKADELTAGGDHGHDLAWLSSDHAFKLRTAAAGYAGEMPLSTDIADSPVVIGIKPAVAARLRAADPGRELSWADVADAAAAGRIRFAMADPRQASSGLSALVGVATAAAGQGRALTVADVGCDRLGGFFQGQSVTAATATELADKYVAAQDDTDALVTYESAVLSLNASGRLRQPLELLYPRDGLVLAEFPLLLLDSADRAAYDRAVAWLTGPDGQRDIMRRTLRRPIDPQVARDPRLRPDIGNALYYPDRQAVLDKLLSYYGARDPGQVIFVLDWSGSMRGARLARLRATFAGLGGADRSAYGKFVRFAGGERVTLLRFGGSVLATRTFAGSDAAGMNAFLAENRLDDRTAVWSALLRAYDVAGSGPRTSIVLMTDGESNAGMSADEFLRRYRGLPASARGIHTYAIGLGEANPAELDRVARATGGRTIAATTDSLQDAFKEVRGCG